MVSEVQQVQLRRLKEKHADGLLLWELKNGFELSPRESDLVLETAKGILLEGKTLFIFDEPTTGLHLDDIATLLKCFDALVGAGHSLIVIEHNMNVVKCADFVIDLGPEAGDGGGEIVATGTPEEITLSPRSHTGRFLRQYR